VVGLGETTVINVVLIGPGQAALVEEAGFVGAGALEAAGAEVAAILVVVLGVATGLELEAGLENLDEVVTGAAAEVAGFETDAVVEVLGGVVPPLAAFHTAGPGIL
jgi:hypothetical protein